MRESDVVDQEIAKRKRYSRRASIRFCAIYAEGHARDVAFYIEPDNSEPPVWLHQWVVVPAVRWDWTRGASDAVASFGP